MTGYTESSFERKCAELNQSQQSIQSLSTWLIHHRKHIQNIVKIWYKEFVKAEDHRKLTFIYLGNDIIQNGRKKGPEIGKAFIPIWKKALEHMGNISGDKMKNSCLRILGIWKERGVYEPILIEEFEKIYLDTLKNKNSTSTKRKQSDLSDSKEILDQIDKKIRSNDDNESINTNPYSNQISSNKKKNKGENGSKKRRTSNLEKLENENETVQCEVKLSPSPFIEPPTEEELLNLLKEMDKMPSNDAVTRGQIASLSPSISNPSGVEEICIDSDACRPFYKQVNGAYSFLNDYNKKLSDELVQRKTFSMKLQDFLHAQKDLLTQAEQRLEDHQNHQKILTKRLDELKSHVLSMPDLTKLPTVHGGGLQPLPSAGDLFQ